MEYLLHVALFGGLVACCAAQTVEAAGLNTPVRRTETCTMPQVGARTKVAPETLLYSEFLIKYGMFPNYLHYWIDRPLFWNRATRPEKFEYETASSVAITARQLTNAGLDGLNCFVHPNKTRFFKDINSWFSASGADRLNVLPSVSYGEAVDRSGPNVKAFADAVRMVQADVRATRIKGKVLVSTYNYRLFTVEQHRKFLAELKSELGNDLFILCGDIPFQMLNRLRKSFHNRGRLTDAEVRELEDGIRDVLDVAGGIQASPSETIRNPKGQYCSYYDTSFFDTYMGPMLERLLALPEYREKVLGFYIHQGYINHLSGHDHSEEGTYTLRRDLQSALRLNPDYLIFFEWNEHNENTMFQPTVWGGQVACRILNYYSRFLKGLKPAPYAGDDTRIPPLVLSYRATAKIGEFLHFELLNIPDGVWQKPVSARLFLEDSDGRQIADFPVESIDPTKLGSVDYRIPTSALAGGTVLVPSLVAEGVRYDGFSPIRLDPTACVNYKTVRQALREQLRPLEKTANVTKVREGEYGYGLKATFPERLMSVELVENENEQAACGTEKEYDFANNAVLRLAFTAPRSGSVPSGEVTIRVTGATGCSFLPLWRANVNHGSFAPLADGSGVRVTTLFWSQEMVWFAQVPKKDLGTAKLAVSMKGADFVPAEFSVAKILRDGLASRLLRPETSLRVDVRPVYDLPDLPFALGSDSVDWKGSACTKTHRPTFHFRAISESGRIWRSRPFVPDAIGGEMVDYPVWDDIEERPVMAKAPAALMPVLDYRFDPSVGVSLASGWEPFYDAYLGAGFFYNEAYSEIDKGRIEPGCRAPKWVRDDGVWCLAFDGTNDYVNLPREALPNAAFTLSMEVKPELDEKEAMVLFRHASWIRGSIALFVVDGKLVARWGDRDLSKEPTFDTGLAVKNREWNSISVSYDFGKFAFTVNGETKEFPWTGRAWAFKPAIFGGHDKTELAPSNVKLRYFRGLLRKLEIRHGS